MKSLKYVILLLCLICGCYTHGPYIKFERDFSGRDSSATIAVLNFDYSGNLLSSQIALQAADNLTSEIFVKKGIKVIDRSLVKEILKRYEKTKSSRLSKEEIYKIGQDLGARYLILGSIHSGGSIDDYYESRDYQIEITLRFIETSDSRVIGIVKHRLEDDTQIEEIIARLIEEIVFFMREAIV